MPSKNVYVLSTLVQSLFLKNYLIRLMNSPTQYFFHILISIISCISMSKEYIFTLLSMYMTYSIFINPIYFFQSFCIIERQKISSGSIKLRKLGFAFAFSTSISSTHSANKSLTYATAVYKFEAISSLLYNSCQ